MKVEKFFEKNMVQVFKTLQIIFVLLAISHAAYHQWLGVLSNLVMCAALEAFIGNVRLSQKRKATICMLVDVIKHHNEKPEAEQDKDSLVGRTVVETGHCDTCPNEQSDCKKLILTDGSHICVK